MKSLKSITFVFLSLVSTQVFPFGRYLECKGKIYQHIYDIETKYKSIKIRSEGQWKDWCSDDIHVGRVKSCEVFIDGVKLVKTGYRLEPSDGGISRLVIDEETTETHILDFYLKTRVIKKSTKRGDIEEIHTPESTECSSR